jgi:hypothetical protein
MTTEAENIDQLIKALRKVPAKSLRLIELANQIPITHGVFDQRVLADMQPEIKLAIDEAKMYGAYTHHAVQYLSDVKAMRSIVDVRSG